MWVQEIHIHEDDWGMRNLYPIAAWDEARGDLRAAVDRARDSAAADGVGWTSIHVILTPKADFTTIGLPLADAVCALEPFMPRVGSFVATATAGFDRSRMDPWGYYSDNPVCFGFDAHCFLKIEPQDNLVKAIWFEASTDDAGRREALKAAIERLDALAESFVADYCVDACGRVRDRAFMNRYFEWLENN